MKKTEQEERKSANYAKNFAGKNYAKGGLIDKIKKRFAFGGNVPSNSTYQDSVIPTHKFDYDEKNTKKLARIGFKADGTRSRMGKWGSVLIPGFGVVTNNMARNDTRGSNSDTANVLRSNSGEENKLRESMYFSMVAAAAPEATKNVMHDQKGYKANNRAQQNSLNNLNQENPNLQKQSAESTYDKWADGLGMAGKVVGTIYGKGGAGLGKKKDKDNSNTTTPVSNTVSTRNTDYNPGTTDPVLDNATPVDNSMDWKTQKYQKGGKITGKGTAKSDSIPAKLASGSFVVPAENAEEAAELRKKYLDNNKLAKVKGKSGVDVKVSNGEHLFTPREVAVLKSKGVDLNKLAPEAKEEDKLKDGGPVDPETTKLLAQAKKLKDQKLANDKKVEEENKHAALLSHVDAHQKIMSSKYKALTAAQENLKKAIASGSSVDEAESNLKKISQDYNASWEEHKKMQEDKNYEKSPSGYKYNAGTPSVVAPAKPASKPTTTKAINKISSLKPELNVDPENTDAPNDTITASPDALGETENNVSAPELAAAKANNTTPVVAKDGKVKTLLGKFNAADALALAQVGGGIVGLMKQGKRPQYQIGADVIEDAEQAKQDAKTGLSPAEKALAERTINQSQVDAFANINNLSNGNAAVALNHSRGVTVDTANEKLGLIAKDALIKLEKRRYKSGIVNQLENRRRQQFEDKMQGFQQNQEAFAGLTQAGLSNFFGNQQFKEAVGEQDKRNELLGIPKKD